MTLECVLFRLSLCAVCLARPTPSLAIDRANVKLLVAMERDSNGRLYAIHCDLDGTSVVDTDVSNAVGKVWYSMKHQPL